MADPKKSSHHVMDSQSDDSKKSSGQKGGTAMTHQHGGNQPFNPLLGAAVGAIAGAAVGVAASVALSDDKTREKAAEFMGDMRDKAAERIGQITKNAKTVAKKAVDQLPEAITEENQHTAQSSKGRE